MRILFSILTLVAFQSYATVDQVSFSTSLVCEGSQTTLTSTATVSGGATIIEWNWDLDADGQFNDATGASINHQFNASGTFNVGLQIITDIDPPVAAYDLITVNPVPTADFTAPDVCEGTTSALADQSSIASGTIDTYQWDLDNDGLYNDDSGSLIANNFGAAGSYAVGLQVTSDQGCQATTSEIVVVDPTPSLEFAADGVCLGNQTELSASASVSSGQITSYEWELNGNGLFDDASGATVTNQFSADGDYQIGLRVTTDQGCENDTFQLVTIAPFPFVGFLADDACQSQEVSFTNVTNNVVGSIDYEWTFALEGTSIETDPTFTFASAGPTQVTLIGTTSFGCADTMVQTIEVFPTPAADFTFTEVCVGNTTFFTNETDPKGATIDEYDWFFGDAINTQGVGTNPTFTYTEADSFLVSMVASTTDGCTDTVEHFVNVWALPNPEISADGPVEFCDGNEVTLTVAPTGETTIWSTGETGSSIAVDTTDTYEVTVIDENGCQGEELIEVYSWPLPVLQTRNDTTISLGENVFLWATGANTYEWLPATYLDLYDPNAGIPNDTVTSFNPESSLTYTVIGTDLNGCQSQADIIIDVIQNYDLQPVNLFTPNGDGDNERFYVGNIDSYNDCTLRVYNRWGLEVYSSNAYINDWTGDDFNGDNLPDGTYYYTIECDGRDDRFDGAVTILR